MTYIDTSIIKDQQLNALEFRTDFNKDRDKILYSKAFRRLQRKTQVFHSSVSDHFRTRLTHTLEVSQLSRTVADRLELYEDLAEAIALGHDVGHTPYGHAGENTLNKILNLKNKEVRSCVENVLEKDDFILLSCGLLNHVFKHNLHSLKVLDELEKNSPNYDGYNLTNLTKEGIIKHTKIVYKKDDTFRFWGNIDPEEVNIQLDEKGKVKEETYNTFLEAQIVCLCDEIAQATHDLEDGVRTSLLGFDEVFEYVSENFFPIFNNDQTQENIKKYNKENHNKNEVMDFIISCLIYHIVNDCVESSKEQIINNYNESIMFPKKTICLSPAYSSAVEGLQKLLVDKIIFSEAINQMDVKAEKFITELFVIFYKYPLLLPDSSLDYYAKKTGKNKLRNANKEEKDTLIYEYQKDCLFFVTIIDYIAGMTDSFLERVYNKFNLSGAI